MSAKENAAIKIAAELLRLPLSDIAEDWPTSMPKIALRRIAAQEERLKDVAVRVRYIGSCLSDLDRECEALRRRVAELEAQT